MDTIVIQGVPYINLGLLARGGIGEVYRVTDGVNNYAVKVLQYGNEFELDRYKAEIELLVLAGDSDRVIKCYSYDIDTENHTVYILLELADIDLNKLLFHGTFPLEYRTMKCYWKAMLLCVLALHDRDIVHLDLKPLNFVLVGNTVKAIDLGGSRIVGIDGMTEVRDVGGTILYMAPEVLSVGNEAKKIGLAADIWSMGCILYQMVCGYCPYERTSGMIGKMDAIRSSAPIVIDVDDEDLRDCLSYCLDKNPTNRPTVRDLLTHPFLDG